MVVYCGIIKAFIARVPEQYLFKYFYVMWLQKKPKDTVLLLLEFNPLSIVISNGPTQLAS